MTLLTRVSALPMIVLLGCGDALVDQTYRGEPIIRLEGQLRSFEPARPTTNAFYVSVFWSVNGETIIEPSMLVEQDSVGVKVEFPNSFLLNVFDVPPDSAKVSAPIKGTDYWLGMILIYEDVNGNGKFDSAELRGGAEDTILIYTKSGISASLSPTGRKLSGGYQVMRLPISCACDVRVGEACTSDADCGSEGFCVQELGGVNFSGGYCSVRVNGGNCLPAGSKAMLYPEVTINDPSGIPETLAYKKCANDSACRQNEGYLCCQGVCRPPELEDNCSVFDNCQVPIGDSCKVDSDCGVEGKCLTRLGFDSYTNGYCTLPAESACIPDSATPTFRINETGIAEAPDFVGYYHLECNSDADCRESEGYACSPYESICAPVQPVYLTVDKIFSPAPICRAVM